MAEFERFAPGLDDYARRGGAPSAKRMRIRSEACDRHARESELASKTGAAAIVLITSYDLLRIDAGGLRPARILLLRARRGAVREEPRHQDGARREARCRRATASR